MPADAVSLAGVDYAARLLAALDHPQRGLKRVLHVTGTNGKGSTVAMLESVLRHAGYRTGMTTSPQLHRPGDRIRIDGRPMATDEMVSLIEESILPAAAAAGLGSAPCRTFAIYTSAALLAFQRHEVDVAIVEVGRGGSNDATNVFERPLATAITTVTLDHQAVLGQTLSAIAATKAGIMRPGVPMVTGANGEALATIRARAADLGAPVVVAAPARSLGDTPGGQRLHFAGTTLTGDYDLALHGDFQLLNAAIVLNILEAVQDELPVPLAAVRAGLAAVRWPARLEHAEALGVRWLFDGAHNSEGAEVLAAHLTRRFAGHALGLIYGTKANRRYEEFVGPLRGVFDAVWTTKPPITPSLCADPVTLAAADWGSARTEAVPAYPDAIFAAWQWARSQSGPALIVVAGQIPMVGAIRDYLGLES